MFLGEMVKIIVKVKLIVEWINEYCFCSELFNDIDVILIYLIF